MYFKAITTFALAFLSVGVHAVPTVNLAKRDGNNESTLVLPRIGTLSAAESLTARVLPPQLIAAISIPGCK